MSSLARLARRVAMAFGLGRQTADTDESRSTSTVQVALASGELRSDVPVMQLYGFASRSVPGSDLALMFISGDRTRAVAVASGDQRGRPTDLEPGEVCLYHPRTGSRILLNERGGVEITADDDNISLNGNVLLNGSINVSGNAIIGTGATGSVSTGTGRTLTIRNGLITNIY
ncbi:hypothetical protein GWK89_03110 [Gluconobacter kondonii]|nr:hypothetical protein [Gluconobacter kondonii]